MRETRQIMGMPVIIEIVGAPASVFAKVFDYFVAVDERFSTYKSASEIARINRGEIAPAQYSSDMREVFALAKQTAGETDGYFSITTPSGSIDPSGIVKGWAINNAAKLVESMGYENYYIDAGGDIQTKGLDAEGKAWTIGIRNPFNR
jgi:thiamine biosynthesis lipoprotein